VAFEIFFHPVISPSPRDIVPTVSGSGEQHKMIGVYGANGFIGRHLVRRLAAYGHSVRSVSRSFGADFIQPLTGKVDFVEADFREPLPIASTLVGVDTIVQLISTSSPALQNRFATADIKDNVIPHVDFIQSAVQAGVRRYVFVSSGGTVYGPNARVPIPEDAITTPISSHGLTKLTIEKYLQMYGHVEGLDYVILRVANPFGPRQVFRKGQGLIPAALARYRAGQPIDIVGGGRAVRDYLYIDDLVDAIVAAIDRPAAAKKIINVGSGVGHSVIEVLDAIEAELGGGLLRRHAPDRSTDVDRNILDIARANDLLEWSPKVPFDTGIERTVRAFLLQPQGS